MYDIELFECIDSAEKTIYECNLALESMHPEHIINDVEEVLIEAGGLKLSVKKAIDSIIKMIKTITAKFTNMISQLKKKNAEWLTSVANFDVSKVDLNKFTYDIFDYKAGIDRIRSVKIPQFIDEDIPLLEQTDGDGYKDKYFKNIFDKEHAINKNYFRGSEEKKTITGAEAKTLFGTLYQFIRSDYQEIAMVVAKSNYDISKLLETVSNTTVTTEKGNDTTTESALLSQSIFKDELIDILIESALLEDAVTPDDIDKEESKDDDNKTDVNINKEANDDVKNNNNRNDAMRIYAKICMSVNTARMAIIEEIYSQGVKLIETIMK